MVELKLGGKSQYDDLRMIFPQLLVKMDTGDYVGLRLASNHIKINGILHYWNDGGFGRAYNPDDEEEAVIKLYSNSFELVVDGNRRVICEPEQIKSLTLTCKGIFSKEGYNSTYFIEWR